MATFEGFAGLQMNWPKLEIFYVLISRISP
jgi:hypothetical protein